MKSKDKEVGTRVCVFINFQADNYGTSSGDDERNCLYNWKGGEAGLCKYCK